AAVMHEWRLFRLFREPGAAAEYLCSRHSFGRFEPYLMGLYRYALLWWMVQPTCAPLHFRGSGLSEHTTLAAAHALKNRWCKWPRRGSGRADRGFKWPTVGLTIDGEGRTFTGEYILLARAYTAPLGNRATNSTRSRDLARWQMADEQQSEEVQRWT